MDPSDPGEKCLPEMGLSGWMKRTMERSYDLTDFCNSPPADGFFHPTTLQKGNGAGIAGRGNCGAESRKKEEIRSCTIMGGVLSINQPISRHLTHTLSDPSMYQHQTVGVNNMGGGVCDSTGGENPSRVADYLKPVVSGISSVPLTKQMALGLQQNMNTESTVTPPGEGRMMGMHTSSNDEVRNWTNASERQERFRSADNMDLIQSHPSDDSAPTPVDHIVNSRYTPTIITTPADEGGSVGIVEKLGAGIRSCPSTPETPNTTPAVTPSCSPQIARRAGNPFFTGGSDNDDGNSGTSSWLFKPGKKVGDGGAFQSDKLYEAKVEFQAQPNSKLTKKTVRYVPRPSELRELNFWSPTSM